MQSRKTLPKLITANRTSLNLGGLVSPVILTPGALNLTPTQLLGGIKWLDIVSPKIQSVSYDTVFLNIWPKNLDNIRVYDDPLYVSPYRSPALL